MFRSDIILKSSPDGTPEVSTGSATVVEPIDDDLAGSHGTGPVAFVPPATGILEPAIVSALQEILRFKSTPRNGGNIVDSLAKLERCARDADDPAARQMAEHARAATMTRKSILDEMRSGEWLRRGDRAEREANIRMVEAMRSGSASVLDLEDIGLRSRGIYTIHFTATGTFAGVSSEIVADFDAIARFQERSFLRSGDGSMTDKATGRNANFIQDGHKFLYVVWP
ncbi:hypothetical protein [Oricola thermophila]|uniref:Uncharacterized protein n=1 Tax=Oricola thermophila TaxID=2742145 RepID=A0A6N1VGF9_9HYPH|nr:hypothetical protein [Oricola thermophila]QKV18352.1 hypothetical protein HTY61_07735 [Oricola thermophila]